MSQGIRDRTNLEIPHIFSFGREFGKVGKGECCLIAQLYDTPWKRKSLSGTDVPLPRWVFLYYSSPERHEIELWLA